MRASKCARPYIWLASSCPILEGHGVPLLFEPQAIWGGCTDAVILHYGTMTVSANALNPCPRSI